MNSTERTDAEHRISGDYPAPLAVLVADETALMVVHAARLLEQAFHVRTSGMGSVREDTERALELRDEARASMAEMTSHAFRSHVRRLARVTVGHGAWEYCRDAAIALSYGQLADAAASLSQATWCLDESPEWLRAAGDAVSALIAANDARLAGAL